MTLTDLQSLRRHLTYVAEDPDQELTAESRYELAQARRKVRDAIALAESEQAKRDAVIPSLAKAS